MAPSDFASGIDDSFEDILGPPTGARHKPDVGHGRHRPRSGSWSVSDGTVAGSGIDDSDTILNFTGRRTGGYETGYERERQIPGAVLDKFAKAAAADHEKERRRKQLESIAEQEADSDEDKKFTKRDRVKKQEAKFYIPNLNNSRGLRIKSRDGRSEVVREPSLPPLPPLKSGDLTSKKTKQMPRAETVLASSPPASVRSGTTASSGSRAGNFVRIVGKDGREVFMPLPGTLGAFSTASSEVSRPQQLSLSREKDAEKERARRDTKAAEAAKEIRREMDLEEMNKSDARSGSVVSGRSARSSSRVSKMRMEEVFEMGSVASSRTSVVQVEVVEKKQQQKPSARPTEKKQKGVQAKDAPKRKQALKEKPPKPPSPPQWEEVSKENSNPPSKASSRPVSKPATEQPSGRQPESVRDAHSLKQSSERGGQRARASSPTTHKPPSVRSASGGFNTAGTRASSRPSSLCSEVFVKTTTQVSKRRSAARSAGFQQVGEGTYEPIQSEGNSRGASARSNVQSTASAKLEHPSPVRSSFAEPVAEVLQNAYENDPSIVVPSIHTNSFRAARVSQAASEAVGRAAQSHAASGVAVKREGSYPAGYVYSQGQLQGSSQVRHGYPAGNAAQHSSSGTSYGNHANGSGTPSPPFMHGAVPTEFASLFVQPQQTSNAPPTSASQNYQRSVSAASHSSFRPGSWIPSPQRHASSQQSPSGPVPVSALQRPASMGSKGSYMQGTWTQSPHSQTTSQQAPSSAVMQPFVQRSASGGAAGQVPMGSGGWPSQDNAAYQRVANSAASLNGQRPPYPMTEHQQARPSPLNPGYQSPLQQAYQRSPAQQMHIRQQSTSTAHRLAPAQPLQSHTQQGPSDAQSPTVFAGRGWISPHPLSIASSEADQPQSAIRVPAGHAALRGSQSDVAGPATLTYSEYKAVQEEKSTIIEKVGSAARDGQTGRKQPFEGHDGMEYMGEEQRGAAGGGSVDSGGGQRRTSNWSRTTSSQSRVSAGEVGGDQPQAGGADDVATVGDDGKVQLKMPWDGLF